MQKFVLIVDSQFDFVMPNGKLYIKGAESIIAPMQNYLASLNVSNCSGVLFTLDTHYLAEYLQSPEHLQDKFPPHCIKDSIGHHLVIDLNIIDPKLPVYTLEKTIFNMWQQPNLQVTQVTRLFDYPHEIDRDSFFSSLISKGVVEIVVMGVASDYCVKYAIEGLINYKFNISILKDATCGINQPIDEIIDNRIVTIL